MPVAVLPTFDMLLFGGTGDLVTRKLLPALYRRCAAGQVSAVSRILGVARTRLSRVVLEKPLGHNTQPDESITLTILAKNPGEGMRLKPVNLALDLGETFKTRSLDAYERLLMDIVKGNLTLFMRRDELDAAWAWVDPIRAGWEQYDERPKVYIAGSWGPASSSAMLGRDGFAWHDEL